MRIDHHVDNNYTDSHYHYARGYNARTRYEQRCMCSGARSTDHTTVDLHTIRSTLRAAGSSFDFRCAAARSIPEREDSVYRPSH